MQTLTLTPTNGHSQPPADLAGLSALSPTAALWRPVAELVTATLDAAGRTDQSKRAYLAGIGQFLTYLDQTHGQDLPDEQAATWRPFALASIEGRRTLWTFKAPAAVLRFVTPATLDGFRASLDAGGAKTNTAGARLAAVNTFLRVAYRENVLTDEQARALELRVYRTKTRRDTQPVGRRLTKAEVRKLRAAPDLLTNKGKRDLAILDACLYLGLRSEECASLELADFRPDGGRLWLTLLGKGRKTRRLKVPDVLYKSLAMWLTASGLGELGNGAGAVFRGVNRGGNLTDSQVSGSTINRLVAEYGAAAGLAPEVGAGRLGPHDLRRTCARNAYDNGAPLLLIQAMLGHSDPKTTAHYIGAFEDDNETATDFVRY